MHGIGPLKQENKCGKVQYFAYVHTYIYACACSFVNMLHCAAFLLTTWHSNWLLVLFVQHHSSWGSPDVALVVDCVGNGDDDAADDDDNGDDYGSTL